MLREPGLTLKKSVREIQAHGYEGVPSNPTYDKTITDPLQINQIMSFLKSLQAADPDYIYTERSGSTVCNLTIVYEDNTKEKMTITDEELWCEGRWYNPLKIDDLIDLL